MRGFYERCFDGTVAVRRAPCSRGFIILLMHSSAWINNSCEARIRWKINSVTRSYSMIVLIIRSLCWSASNFQATQQGTQVSEMIAGRSELWEELNVNLNYRGVFQYLNMLDVS